MFELIVEILHNDNRETSEPYRECEVLEHSVTGETRLNCTTLRYPTLAACKAQIAELDAKWMATRAREGRMLDLAKWAMRCEQIAPLTS
jgi:hypothetical protein